MSLHRPALVPLALVAVASCSLVAVQRVPSGHKSGDPLECTSSLSYPLIDAVVTVLSGVLAVNLLSASGNDSESKSGLRATGFGSLALSAGALGSTVYGVLQVNRCRGERAALGIDDGVERIPIEDKTKPGQRGGACRADGSCDPELVCDAPMNVCIPLQDSDE